MKLVKLYKTVDFAYGLKQFRRRSKPNCFMYDLLENCFRVEGSYQRRYIKRVKTDGKELKAFPAMPTTFYV